MSDNQDQTGTGAGSEGQPPNQSTAGSGANGEAEALTSERSANKLIKDFAKAKGVSVADLLARYDDLENATKSELQKATDKAADWERKYGDLTKELRVQRAEQAFRDTAAAANARPDRLAHLWRMVRDEVEYDSDGKPRNVGALVEQQRKDSPEWFQAVAGSGDGGKTGEAPADPNTSINTALRRMAGYGTT